jgi:hypothetical protein
MRIIETILFVAFVLISQASAQITSADAAIREAREAKKPALTLTTVKANQVDLQGKVFPLRLFVNMNHDIVQLDTNRYELWIEAEPDAGGIQLMHILQLGKTVNHGGVVLVRIKDDAANFTLECVGVSAFGVWE